MHTTLMVGPWRRTLAARSGPLTQANNVKLANMAAVIKLRAERKAEKLPVAQRFTPSSHLSSVPAALDAVVCRCGEGIGQGDMFIMDDPFDGAIDMPVDSAS